MRATNFNQLEKSTETLVVYITVIIYRNDGKKSRILAFIIVACVRACDTEKKKGQMISITKNKSIFRLEMI